MSTLFHYFRSSPFFWTRSCDKMNIMLKEYTDNAIEDAAYKKLDDGSWFAEIPGFEGVWANAATVEACRKELIEVLEEWLILKFRDHEQVPVAHGIDINIKVVSSV